MVQSYFPLQYSLVELTKAVAFYLFCLHELTKIVSYQNSQKIVNLVKIFIRLQYFFKRTFIFLYVTCSSLLLGYTFASLADCLYKTWDLYNLVKKFANNTKIYLSQNVKLLQYVILFIDEPLNFLLQHMEYTFASLADFLNKSWDLSNLVKILHKSVSIKMKKNLKIQSYLQKRR